MTIFARKFFNHSNYMTARVLLVFAVLAIVIVISLVGRNLYLRSLRLRRRLQMSNIFTNITHELLTPLTVISASVDKLRDVWCACSSRFSRPASRRQDSSSWWSHRVTSCAISAKPPSVSSPFWRKKSSISPSPAIQRA